MESNIILTGMPGSGKTTIGKEFAKKMGMDFLDFDDNVIEERMQDTVGNILDLYGEDLFLKMEEEFALNLDIKNTVLSTSGSLPLNIKVMKHLRKFGHTILINVPLPAIKRRLETMKVDRIVGMKNMTLDQILKYRNSFYQKSYDYRFDNNGLNSKEKIFEDFTKFYRIYVNKIK